MPSSNQFENPMFSLNRKLFIQCRCKYNIVATEWTEFTRLFLQSSEFGPPTPHTSRSPPPLVPGGGGEHTAGEGLGCPNSDEETDTLYFVAIAKECKVQIERKKERKFTYLHLATYIVIEMTAGTLYIHGEMAL